MLDQVQLFYDEVFDNLKKYIIENSKNNPYVFKEEPKDSLFPLVVVKNTSRNNTYTTLNYSDETYTFALQINIYSISTEGKAGRSICTELSNIIEKFFKEEMRMQLNINPTASNLDESVDRTIINATCTINTKYKDKIVYSPF